MPRRISNNQYTANAMALWKPTRRTILRAGGLIAAPAIIGHALAQVPLTGAGRGAPGGAAPSTATFDPAQKFQITLSGGNLTATNSVGAASFGNARGTTSHSTGKFYIEWTITFSVTDQCAIGLCNTTRSFASGFYCGGVTDAMGIKTSSPGGGSVVFNGVLGTYEGGAASSGEVAGMAVDIGAGLIWFRANAGGWNNDIIANQNPATGTGGFNIAGLGTPLFFCCDVESNATTGTLNAGGSAYANAAPAGFGAWT